jgi:hypothetical protein
MEKPYGTRRVILSRMQRTKAAFYLAVLLFGALVRGALMIPLSLFALMVGSWQLWLAGEAPGQKR